jgi:hypothetical protein
LVRPDGIVSNEDGSKRPQSAIFSDHRADGAMSVFLEDEIVAQGRQPEELFDVFDPTYEVCWHYVDEYSDLGQQIERAESEEFPGHANVTDSSGKRSAARKTKLALSARWLERPEKDMQ